jgi:hypothetical protein
MSVEAQALLQTLAVGIGWYPNWHSVLEAYYHVGYEKIK